jgi:hypothetical protein
MYQKYNGMDVVSQQCRQNVNINQKLTALQHEKT